MSFPRGGLLLLGVVSIFLTGCFNQSTIDTIVLNGPEGLTMHVQELPEGVAREDISIRAMDSDKIPLDGDRTDWRGYDLGPDGTTFSTGVLIEIPYESGMPTYYHLHDGVASPILNVTYNISDEGNIASFIIKDFSLILEHEGGVPMYGVTFVVGEAAVGDYLPITAKVTLTKFGIDDTGKIIDVKENKSTIRGSLRANGPVSPSVLLNKPSETKINETYTLIANSDVRCLEEGEVEGEYHVILTYWTDYLFDFAATDWDIGDVPALSHFKVKTSGVCVKPKPVCGDGKVNTQYEECDGTDMQNKTCRDFGFNAGTLTCSPTCLFEYELCKKIPERIELSCAQNSWEEVSEFDDSVYVCRNDCDSGTYCDTATCTCKDQEDPIPFVEPEETIQEEIQGLLEYLEENKDPDTEEEPEDDCDLPGVDCDDDEEPTPKNMIKAIQWKEHIIPIKNNIHTGSGPECDTAEHRHADGQTVKTLAGKDIPDPDGTGCGFGKTKDVPVIEVEDTGVMIQIDPPRTIMKF